MIQIITETEFKAQFGFCPESADTDNDGQIVVYTGLFRWEDGTIREEPEPDSSL